MSSTYSSSLRIELIGTGDQAGTWGVTTNTNLGTLMEAGICGYTSVAVASANQALTALDGAADEARNAVLALTTNTSANFAVYAPPVEKTYVIYNASSYTATIYNSTVLGNTTAAGTGVAIPAGKTVAVWSDGTNFAVQISHLPSLTLTTDLAVADGGTGASTAANARTNLGLGTIATQAANNVSITGGAISGASVTTSSATITGGSITGITDLAVADGGTGASTAANARTNLGLVIGTDVQAYNAGLADIAGLAKTDGNLIVGNGTNWVAESGSTARASLGLGTIATQNSSSVSITGGSITGITDLAVADGGTGQSTYTNGQLLIGNAAGGLTKATLTAGTGISISNGDGAITVSGTANPIPSGSVMLFVQTAAPTGWTKSTTHDNKALRVVSGTASSGGSVGFTTAFGTPSVSGSVSGTVGSTTLTIAQMPSHNHGGSYAAADGSYLYGSGRANVQSPYYTYSTGGGGSHDHSFSGSLSSATASINVQYVDVIICTKD